MSFSALEKRDMLRIYYMCNRNSETASRLYLEEYPERQQPHYSCFLRLDRNLATYGSFVKPREKYGRRIEPEEQENIVNAVSCVIF